MKINFNSKFSNDKGTLLFVCVNGKPLHKYLTDLDNRNSSYISHAMKIVNFNYKDNNHLDLILPKGSKADRIILVGIDEKKLSNDLDVGKLGSNITSILNINKIKEINLVFEEKSFNAVQVAMILYGISLNTYRFNKYFSDKKKIRANFIEKINLYCENHNKISKEWKRFNAIKEGVFLTRDLVSEPANNLTPLLLSKEAIKLRKVGLKVELKLLRQDQYQKQKGASQSRPFRPVILQLLQHLSQYRPE